MRRPCSPCVAIARGRAPSPQPELRDPPRQLESVGQRRRLHQGAPDPTKQGAGDSTPHVRNFVECIRTLNICREAGRPVLNWAPKVERFHGPGAEEANAKLSRNRRKGYELPAIG